MSQEVVIVLDVYENAWNPEQRSAKVGKLKLTEKMLIALLELQGDERDILSVTVKDTRILERT